MASTVRSMWDPFGSLFRQLDSDFENMVRRTFGSGGEPAPYVPPADAVRDGDDVLVTLELPGVDVENDVEVEVSEGRLMISGRRGEERGRDEGGVLIRESRTGAFRREFALPEHVTADDIDATYDRGLLKIRVRGVSKPKSQARRIEVRNEPSVVEGRFQS